MSVRGYFGNTHSHEIGMERVAQISRKLESTLISATTYSNWHLSYLIIMDGRHNSSSSETIALVASTDARGAHPYLISFLDRAIDTTSWFKQPSNTLVSISVKENTDTILAVFHVLGFLPLNARLLAQLLKCLLHVRNPFFGKNCIGFSDASFD